MRISLLCSDEQHPVNEYLQRWMEKHASNHKIELVNKKENLSGGDILFLISCSEIIAAYERKRYRACLVMHASDLPLGRGWSPLVWQIIEGVGEITLTLLEAEDRVDSGRIWKKLSISIPSYALWNEINAILFRAEIELIEFAIENFETVTPQVQDDCIQASYYSRRTPSDSEINPYQSIASQFNKIRVCDPNRFPAFFELYGKKFKLILERIDE